MQLDKTSSPGVITDPVSITPNGDLVAAPSYLSAHTIDSPAGQVSLPVELAFLAHCGLVPDDIFAAADRAYYEGVGIVRYMIANRMIEEGRFYRKLAEFIGVPFIDHEVRLKNHGPVGARLHSGLALVETDGAEPDYLAAPEDALLRVVLRRGSMGRRIAITTPSRFRRLTSAQAGPMLAEEAALGLWRKNRYLSFRDGINSLQFGALAALLLSIGFFAAWHFLPTLICCGLICDVMTLGFILHRLVATAASFWFRQPFRLSVPDFRLPHYTIITALYREANIAGQLYEALCSLDYPASKLDVIFVLEEGDEDTRKALAALQMPARFLILEVPDGQPRTKPRALNFAMPFVRGEFVCVYDAEDIPAPDQLRRVVSAYAQGSESLGCVQARLVVGNGRDGVLARLFAIEYAGLFDVTNAGLSQLGWGFPLGGTSNHFRAIR